MSNKYRTGAEKQRFASVRHVRDIGRKPDYLVRKARNRIELYRFAA